MNFTYDFVYSKSKSRIETLAPIVARSARLLIKLCYDINIPIVIVQAHRTIEEQNNLYAQGRSQSELNAVGLSYVKAKPNMQKVTNARGGFSNHNYKHAIDFGLLNEKGNDVIWDTKGDYNGDKKSDWMQVIDIAKKIGFQSGADWKSFVDMPHLEMTFGLSTADFRAGRKPSDSNISQQSQILDKYENNNIQKDDDQPMTAEEKKAFQALSDSVAGLRKELDVATQTISDLTNSKNVLKDSDNQLSSYLKKLDTQVQSIKAKDELETVPEWAKEAVSKAVESKLIDKPDGGSYDFYRLLTVLCRKNLI